MMEAACGNGYAPARGSPTMMTMIITVRDGVPRASSRPANGVLGLEAPVLGLGLGCQVLGLGLAK